jgi:hypothetical protein
MERHTAKAQDQISASVIRGALFKEELMPLGKYVMECVGPDGKVKWREEFDNLVTTVGKNFILDTVLSGSGYTTLGPYLGLISSVGWSAVAATDTMASHAGWTEAGPGNAPNWTTPASGNRQTTPFSAAAAGSKALTAVAAFSISTTGTVKGCFMLTGTGAVATNANAGGTLISAGVFSADKPVSNGDTLNVSYSLALT